MLEIFLIIFLSKKIGRMVEAKGHNKKWYQIGFVISWIVLEICGFIWGAILFGENGIATYLVAIIGAASSYLTFYIIAKSLEDRSKLDEDPLVPVNG
ncbi:hypothetical protein [Nonlabens xiamenensis]|uniref:hypothetical protein n=1 Tax=Nonlabens xiamenensis TaxID=2341043 RepID=UPI000F60C04E|nr:hypothetical protein [Nonlabens xiamenensis]